MSDSKQTTLKEALAAQSLPEFSAAEVKDFSTVEGKAEGGINTNEKNTVEQYLKYYAKLQN